MSIDELAGSPRESLNESSGSSAERRFLIPHNQRFIFAETLPGQAYPHFPQSRVVAIDLQPWSEDLEMSGVIIDPEVEGADYGSQPCLVTVKYGPDYTKKDWPTGFTKPAFRFGTELRYQIKSNSKFLLVPSAAARWEDDDPDDPQIPVTEDVNTSILIPMRAIQLQWDFVDDPPIDAFEDLLGKVNSDVFLGSPPETLLFEGYDIAETFRASVLNPHTNRVTVQITQRRIHTGAGIVGWNHDYREAPAGWVKLLLSDGEPRYKDDAFGGMFA